MRWVPLVVVVAAAFVAALLVFDDAPAPAPPPPEPARTPVPLPDVVAPIVPPSTPPSAAPAAAAMAPAPVPATAQPVPVPPPQDAEAPTQLIVTSEPSGATVVLDGNAVGRTPLAPLRVAPGQHTVKLELDGYGDRVLTMDCPRGRTTAAPGAILLPWPVLDFTQLGDGVTATASGLPASGRVAAPPGRAILVLRRAGFADQTQTFDLVLGQALVVRADPWVRPGLGTAATPRTQAPATPPPPAPAPEPEPKSPAPAPAPAPALPAPTPSPPTPPAPAPPPAEKPSADPRALLRDVAAWDAATSEARLAAAQFVARAVRDDFWRLRIETRSAGGCTHEVAHFTHERSGLDFVLVPGGRFRMGEEDGDPSERPVRDVTVQPFLIGRTECTRSAWTQIAGRGARTWPDPELPVDGASWADAGAWCAQAKLRLPTEAEWEFACRAGTTTRFLFGDDASQADAFAWLDAETRRKPHPPGEKLPNAWGLVDVLGNVAEWCADVYEPTYAGAPADGTARPGPPSAPHVIRGAARAPADSGTGTPADIARSAFRLPGGPDAPTSTAGLRPARSIPLE